MAPMQNAGSARSTEPIMSPRLRIAERFFSVRCLLNVILGANNSRLDAKPVVAVGLRCGLGRKSAILLDAQSVVLDGCNAFGCSTPAGLSLGYNNAASIGKSVFAIDSRPIPGLGVLIDVGVECISGLLGLLANYLYDKENNSYWEHKLGIHHNAI